MPEMWILAFCVTTGGWHCEFMPIPLPSFQACYEDGRAGLRSAGSVNVKRDGASFQCIKAYQGPNE